MCLMVHSMMHTYEDEVGFGGTDQLTSMLIQGLGVIWLNRVRSMIETELTDCYKYIIQCVLNVHLQCLSYTILGTEIHMTVNGIWCNTKWQRNATISLPCCKFWSPAISLGLHDMG